MTKRTRLLLAILLLLLTLTAFGYYISHHRNLLTQLGHTSPLLVVWLLILYVAWFGCLSLILEAGLRVCRARISLKENLLLNAYSSLVNFFVPGQGGPAVRAAYLKKRHEVRIRTYIFSTLLYYACYAILSTLLLLIVSRPWWQTLLGVVAASGVSAIVLGVYIKRAHISQNERDLRPTMLGYVLIATALQAVVQVAIYWSELRSVNGHIALHQVITYAGAANFALFVALTPGAIGIRESFLLFSERLHHITSATIITANVIDRAVFLVFLGLLFLLVLGSHAKDKLQDGLNKEAS